VLGHLAEAQKVLEVIDEMYGMDSAPLRGQGTKAAFYRLACDETANLIVKVKEQVRVKRDTLLKMISTYSEEEATA
jgi:hypothetical protein